MFAACITLNPPPVVFGCSVMLLPIGLLPCVVRLHPAEELVLLNPKRARQIRHSSVPYLNERYHAMGVLRVACLHVAIVS